MNTVSIRPTDPYFQEILDGIRDNTLRTRPVTDHRMWLSGYTGQVKVGKEWVHYRKIDFKHLFQARQPEGAVVIKIPTRANLNDVLAAINQTHGIIIARTDVQGVRIPTVHVGQSRTIALVARDSSPQYCGCVSIRLVNEETQGD